MNAQYSIGTQNIVTDKYQAIEATLPIPANKGNISIF